MPTQPNVLWLSMEDTSPRFGCYGDEIARTPNIDALAEDGRRYPNAFSTAPVCAPSRSAAVTGCYQNSLGTHHMRTTHTNDDAPGLATPYDAVPPHYVRTVSEYFRQAGYYCTNNVKTDYQFGEPFTAWDEHHDKAGWWGREDDDRPFFAAFNNTVTHESGMWPPEERAELAGEAVEELPTGGSLATDPDEVEVPPYLPDTEATRTAIARQYENIHASDAWIGDLLDRLEADGLAENTIVVLWSDHGEGLPRAKRWPYDSGINVPLIVRWPGEIEGDDVSDELVSMVDLAPTLLAACGLDVPQHMDGQRFLGDDDEREYVYAARDRYDETYDMVRIVRGQRYKYVRNYHPGQPYRQWIPFRNRHPAMRDLLRRDAADELQGAESWVARRRPAEELYDLRADPHETENLIDDADHADTRERLRGALDDWLDRTDDFAAEDEAAMTRRRHLGEDEPTTATPTFVPNAPGNREREATPEGADLASPATVSIHCSTQGASIGYTTETGPDARWQLYTGPISVAPGETTLRAKAIRYGFAESDEREATFTVEH